MLDLFFDTSLIVLTQWFMFDVDSSHIRHAMGHIAAYPQLLLLLSHLPSWGSTPSGCLYCRSPYLWYLPWFLVSSWCAAGLLLSAVPAGDIDRQRRLMGAAPQHGTQQQIALSSKCEQWHVDGWRKKGKVSPYSIAEHRVPELIPVLGSQPAGEVSHKPGSRLSLLSARPAVTPATFKRAAASFAAWWTEAQWVWTICLTLLPDSVAAAIWTRALLRLSPAR